jgi:hypothetical protein
LKRINHGCHILTLWLNFHIIGHGPKKKHKVAKIFGDNKFESPAPQKELATTNVFVWGKFSHNGDKKIWNEYGIVFLVL